VGFGRHLYVHHHAKIILTPKPPLDCAPGALCVDIRQPKLIILINWIRNKWSFTSIPAVLNAMKLEHSDYFILLVG
jgi:hypothetical protein